MEDASTGLSGRTPAACSGLLIYEAFPYREGNDLEIEPQRPVVDVPEVVLHAPFHFLKRVGFTAQAVYLCPSRNARLDLVPLHVGFDKILVVLVVRQCMGTRPHDR